MFYPEITRKRCDYTVFNCIDGAGSEGVMINLPGMMKEAELVVEILGGFNTSETTEKVKCISHLRIVCLYSPMLKL
jgi:hypothetical protein